MDNKIYTSNNVTLHYGGKLEKPKVASIIQYVENQEQTYQLGIKRVKSSFSSFSVCVKVESTYRLKSETLLLVTLESGEKFISPKFISISKPKNSKLKDKTIHKVLQLIPVQNSDSLYLSPVQCKGPSRICKQNERRISKRKREDNNQNDTKKTKFETIIEFEEYGSLD